MPFPACTKSHLPRASKAHIAPSANPMMNAKRFVTPFYPRSKSSLSPILSPFIFPIACSIYLVLITSQALAMQVVRLESRVVVPSEETTTEFLKALDKSVLPSQHGLATFLQNITEDDFKFLAAAGLHILSPVQGNTYRVRIDKVFDFNTIQTHKLGMRLVLLQPQDRVRSAIWEGEFNRYEITPPGALKRNYVLNQDGTINLTVRFYADVARSAIAKTLKAYGTSFRMQNDVTWLVTIDRSKLKLLAAEDIFQYIDAAPPPFVPENDKTRPAINVTPLQDFWHLSGRGVQVGIFDKGIDESHDDFGPSRVLDANPNIKSVHGTHVAGTVGGNGNLSVLVPGGEELQWKGMAPQAELIEAVVTERSPGSSLFTGGEAEDHLAYIVENGMDLSNHSYAVSFDGVYDLQNQQRDELIRGIALVNGIQVPGRLQVYSAGNQGQHLWGTRGVGQTGYFSLTKELKNALVVGNWNFAGGITVANKYATNEIADSSSLGPAYDGRIKPDVVAPGISITSTCYDDGFGSCPDRPPSNSFGYVGTDGTSMASAAVSGALALVLEEYALSFFPVVLAYRSMPAFPSRSAPVFPYTTVRPFYVPTPPFPYYVVKPHPLLPSTLRAVMIHTATDKMDDKTWFCNPDDNLLTAFYPSIKCPAGGTGHASVRARLGPDFVTGWGLINTEAAVNIVADRLFLEDDISTMCETKTYQFTVAANTQNLRVTLAWDDLPADAGSDPLSSKLVNDLDLTLVGPDPDGDGEKTYYPWQINQKLTLPISLDDDGATCPLPITVSGRFPPNPTLGDPDKIPLGGFPPAERGPDHLNNIEVVDVNKPASGKWFAKVRGFKISNIYDGRNVGAQKFSLIGDFPLAFLPDVSPPTNPTNLRVFP